MKTTIYKMKLKINKKIFKINNLLKSKMRPNYLDLIKLLMN